MDDIGIDEVGRGCLAGPLVVAAVRLNTLVDGLTDSKLLSKSKRVKLSAAIYETGSDIGIGWVWPNEIDDIGLTKATTLAIERALEWLPGDSRRIIIDGNYNYLPDRPNVVTIIGADKSIPVVSAASIIAKVARDNYMNSIDNEYPDYGFKDHVGYGTQFHLSMLKTHGPSAIHRRSFEPIKSMPNVVLAKKLTN